MKKRWLIPLLALLFFAALVLSLPARTVVQALQLASQGVYLSGLEGRWYKGSARLLQINTPQGLLQFNNAQWQLHWSALLAAKVKVALQAVFDNQPLNADVTFTSDQRVLVQNLNADVRLETIRPFMRQLSVPVNGAISVRSLNAEFKPQAQWPEALIGTARLNNVMLALPVALLDVGTVDVALQGDAESIYIDITDYEGAYGLDGGVTLMPPAIYELALQIKPEPYVDEATVSGLRLVLGSPANGVYYLNYSGRW